MAIDTSALPFAKTAPDADHQKARNVLRTGASFRAAVWMRDAGLDRVTGQPLTKDAEDWTRRGEVCHLQGRGPHPNLKYNAENGILMSAFHHWLSDGRGGKLLKLTDPETGLPAIDARKKIRFTLYERDGTTVRFTRIG